MANLRDLIVQGNSRFIGETNLNLVRSGVWNGSPIGIEYGGTNATTAAGARANLGTWALVMDSYPTLMPADGTTNGWIKIGKNNSSYGLLPSVGGSAGSGHNYIGTSSWYWKYAYIDEIHGALVGNASTASKLTNLTSSDVASSSADWRKVWFTYTDGVTGRPALSDNLVFQTSTNTLKTANFTSEDTTGFTKIFPGYIQIQKNNPANPTADYASIRFSYSGGQEMYIGYTPNDSYRASKGIKVWGSDNDNTNPWFEVEGNIYGKAFVKTGGLPTQFLKADGSVDSNTYATTGSLGNYLPLAGGTMTGLITTKVAATHQGIKAGNTYINAIDGNLIFQNNSSIRFGGDNWDYNVWAGLNYVHSSKIISLGLADGTTFTANSAQSGGKIYTPGVDNIYIGRGTYKVWHEGNDGSGSGLDADTLDNLNSDYFLTCGMRNLIVRGVYDSSVAGFRWTPGKVLASGNNRIGFSNASGNYTASPYNSEGPYGYYSVSLWYKVENYSSGTTISVDINDRSCGSFDVSSNKSWTFWYGTASERTDSNRYGFIDFSGTFSATITISDIVVVRGTNISQTWFPAPEDLVDTYSNQTIAGTKTFSSNIVGNLTGNVTGNTSGSSGYLTLTDKTENECVPSANASLQAFRSTSTTSGGGDGYITAWKWSGNLLAQLFLDVDSTHKAALRFRNSAGTWSNWKKFVFEDGTNASGTWPISISGNAATATSAGSATSATTATNIAGGAKGDLLYQGGSDSTSKLNIGSQYQVLAVNGTGTNRLPAWVSFSKDHHYSPAVDNNADISATIRTGTETWNTPVVNGITLKTDGKGHITGINASTVNIPAQPRIGDGIFKIQANGASEVDTLFNANIARNTIGLNFLNGTDTEVVVTGSNRTTPATVQINCTSNNETNHYSPNANTNATLYETASSSTDATWGLTSFVTGISVNRDSKGHIVGISLESAKLPAGGSGSGLDADTLDGHHADYFATSNHNHGTNKTAWGQTLTNGSGVIQTITGNMSSVGDISFQASGKKIGGIMYFDTTNARIGIGASVGAPSYTLDVNGSMHASDGNAIVVGTPGGAGAANKTSYISAGPGYSATSGRYGLKILACDQSDCQSGLGQDLAIKSGWTNAYNLSIVTGNSSSDVGRLSFVSHKVNATTFRYLGGFQDNAGTVQFYINGSIESKTTISAGSSVSATTTVTAGTSMTAGTTITSGTTITAGTDVIANGDIRAKDNSAYLGTAAGSQFHLKYDNTYRCVKFIFD